MMVGPEVATRAAAGLGQRVSSDVYGHVDSSCANRERQTAQ